MTKKTKQPKFKGLKKCKTKEDLVARHHALCEEYNIEPKHMIVEDHLFAFYGVREHKTDKDLGDNVEIIHGDKEYTRHEQFAWKIDMCKYIPEYKTNKKERYAKQKDIMDKLKIKGAQLEREHYTSIAQQFLENQIGAKKQPVQIDVEVKEKNLENKDSK